MARLVLAERPRAERPLALCEKVLVSATTRTEAFLEVLIPDRAVWPRETVAVCARGEGDVDDLALVGAAGHKDATTLSSVSVKTRFIR